MIEVARFSLERDRLHEFKLGGGRGRQERTGRDCRDDKTRKFHAITPLGLIQADWPSSFRLHALGSASRCWEADRSQRRQAPVREQRSARVRARELERAVESRAAAWRLPAQCALCGARLSDNRPG